MSIMQCSFSPNLYLKVLSVLPTSLNQFVKHTSNVQSKASVTVETADNSICLKADYESVVQLSEKMHKETIHTTHAHTDQGSRKFILLETLKVRGELMSGDHRKSTLYHGACFSLQLAFSVHCSLATSSIPSE